MLPEESEYGRRFVRPYVSSSTLSCSEHNCETRRDINNTLYVDRSHRAEVQCI